MHKLFCTLILVFVCPSLYAGELVFSSGSQQKLLMELYTSEGCSSCPPMELYINNLKSHEKLWKYYIPVAFHVDYWNYIGWEDRYASPGHAERQRRHAKEGNVSAVYTPALLLNGRGWRPGFFSQLPEVKMHTTGELVVRIDQDRLTADYRPKDSNPDRLELHIALLGMGLESNITAGENKGRNSQHEFVVIGHKSLSADGGHWQTSLPELHFRDTIPRALAVWVTHVGSLKPLQSVGGNLGE